MVYDIQQWSRYRRIFLSSGTEKWIEVKKSNKRYIEISFVNEA
jgi:hypothetical protein